MYSKNSGKWSERFLDGKGFYIVLFLCAAVIGMSVWAMNTETETVFEPLPVVNIEDEMVETMRIETPAPTLPVIEEELEAVPVFEEQETAAEELFPEGATAAEINGLYISPVSGSVSRDYCVETLSYDETMGDWRTHAGVDIAAEKGARVVACHAGTVTQSYKDDLLGNVLVIDHGDGLRSVYANLADEILVEVGTWVSAGTGIGSVGASAIGESGQTSHLHFAMYRDGHSENPLSYLSD